jgi:hypothetical protein
MSLLPGQPDRGLRAGVELQEIGFDSVANEIVLSDAM